MHTPHWSQLVRSRAPFYLDGWVPPSNHINTHTRTQKQSFIRQEKGGFVLVKLSEKFCMLPGFFEPQEVPA